MNSRNCLPTIICGLSVPLSLFLWLGNLTVSKIWSSNEKLTVMPPSRWLFSTLGPITLMLIALRRKSINASGATLGVVFAFILSLANNAFFASLVCFFFTSSRATKFRANKKRQFENDFKEGEGQRNWIQVLCNGGMATQLAVLYLIDCGSGERPIDFVTDYRSSWLCVAVMSSFACSNGDTWASELGSVLSRTPPFLITTFERVPRGTNGGVSIIGLFVSLIGGALVGWAFYLTVLYAVDEHILANSASQWPIVVVGAFAGLFGSIVDSILGATIQYSGIDDKGKICDSPGPSIRHICGLRIIDNHSVNLISTIITGVTMPSIALRFWPER